MDSAQNTTSPGHFIDASTVAKTPILIVDDVQDNRDLLEEMLRDEGYEELIQAPSGTDALEILEKRSDIGLILLDLMMPGMDGYETSRRISRNPATAHVPVIVVTGGSLRRDDALRKSFECGAMDFIPKPVSEVELCGRVRSALLLYCERVANIRKTRALLESQQRYELAVNGVNDGIWDLNIAADEVYYSPKFKQILGYEDHEFANTMAMWEAIIHPDDKDRVMALMQEHWNQRTPFYTSEHRLRNRDGEYIWVFSRGRAIWDEQGRVIRMAGSTTDITQRKSLEIQLRQAQQLESIGRLAAGVAHDFNNLLMTILGQANLGKLNAPPESPFQVHFDKIEKASLQAADFCKQMLAYAGQGRYSVESLNLNSLVRETADLIEISVSKKITLRFQLPPEPVFVDADTAQLRQVLLNLYLNAAESIGDKAGSITAKIAVTTDLDSELVGAVLKPNGPTSRPYARLEIADTGSGMSPEVQAKIFDPFFTTKFTGRGLGLSAVLGIIRAHEGAMKVETEVGQGTTFVLFLPRAEAPAPAHAPVKSAILQSWRGSGKVLLVDDEAGVRDIVGALLGELGFDVITAADGLEGIELFREQASSIAAVILDLNMPKLSGSEVFEQIRQINPNARVLLATGYGEEEVVRQFTSLAPSGFLQKPFRFDELEAKLRQCLTSPSPYSQSAE